MDGTLLNLQEGIYNHFIAVVGVWRPYNDIHYTDRGTKGQGFSFPRQAVFKTKRNIVLSPLFFRRHLPGLMVGMENRFGFLAERFLKILIIESYDIRVLMAETERGM